MSQVNGIYQYCQSKQDRDHAFFLISHLAQLRESSRDPQRAIGLAEDVLKKCFTFQPSLDQYDVVDGNKVYHEDGKSAEFRNYELHSVSFGLSATALGLLAEDMRRRYGQSTDDLPALAADYSCMAESPSVLQEDFAPHIYTIQHMLLRHPRETDHMTLYKSFRALAIVLGKGVSLWTDRYGKQVHANGLHLEDIPNAFSRTVREFTGDDGKPFQTKNEDIWTMRRVLFECAVHAFVRLAKTLSGRFYGWEVSLWGQVVPGLGQATKVRPVVSHGWEGAIAGRKKEIDELWAVMRVEGMMRAESSQKAMGTTAWKSDD